MTVADFIAAIPDGIWGVIVGSLLTFIGVGRQLRHDSKQRERERQMQLRRDVYLEAAEGVAGSIDYYFRFINPDLPIDATSPGARFPGWLNKIYMVGSLETITAFTDAGATQAAAMLELARQRFAVGEISAQIAAANDRVADIRKYQEQAKAIAAAAVTEPPTEHLKRALEDEQRRWEQSWKDLREVSDHLERLWTQKAQLHRVLLEQAIHHFTNYQQKLRRAQLALRRELDMPVDEAGFQEALTRIDNNVLPKLRQLLDELEEDTNESAPAG